MGRGYRNLSVRPSCPSRAPSTLQTTYTHSPGLTIIKDPFYLRPSSMIKLRDLPISLFYIYKTRREGDGKETGYNSLNETLTWFKIALYDQFILLLISSSNNKVILRTNEPQELLKPAKLHHSVKNAWNYQNITEVYLYQASWHQVLTKDTANSFTSIHMPEA